jgi:hypothetical protein
MVHTEKAAMFNQDDPRSAASRLWHTHMKVRLYGDTQDTLIAAKRYYIINVSIILR